MGNLKGTFLMDPAVFETIKATLETTKFFLLPKQILPSEGVQLHALDLRIGVALRGKTHQEALYDPSKVTDKEWLPDSCRFRMLFTASFRCAHPCSLLSKPRMGKAQRAYPRLAAAKFYFAKFRIVFSP